MKSSLKRVELIRVFSPSKAQMSGEEYVCEVCGKRFADKRALGSHVHYKHGSRAEGGGEALDLREEFKGLLTDLGVKAGRSKVLSDIYFDLDPQDMERLDELLRLSGIPNPTRGLILQRWSQRIGKPLPKELLKESEEASEPIFDLYDKMAQQELRQLLLEDMRSRIEERRRKLGLDERKGEEKEFETPCPCSFPVGYVTYGQDGRMTYFCTLKQRTCTFYTPIELATCNYCYLDVRIDSVLPGMCFRCPRCGAEYVKTHPGRVTLMKAYAPLTMLQ